MTTSEGGKDFNFGDWLKSQRESKKVTLEEIAAVTKIHISQLHNLESGTQQKLPTAAFIRGFLVSYSKHLGLDVDEVLGRYREWRGPLANDSQLIIPQGTRVGQSATHPKIRMVTTPNFKQAPGTKDLEENFKKLPSMKSIFVFGAAMVVLLTVAVLVSIGRQKRREKEREKVQAKQTTEAVDNAATSAVEHNAVLVAASAVPEKVEVAKAPETKVAGPLPALALPAVVASKNSNVDLTKKYQLELRALEQSWVNVRLDDGDLKGLALKSGSSYPFSIERRVMLSLSNAGGVEIRWNGQWYDAPGFRGDVKALTLPEQLATLVPRVAPKAIRTVKPKVVDPNAPVASGASSSPSTLAPKSSAP